MFFLYSPVMSAIFMVTFEYVRSNIGHKTTNIQEIDQTVVESLHEI